VKGMTAPTGQRTADVPIPSRCKATANATGNRTADPTRQRDVAGRDSADRTLDRGQG